MLYVGQVFRWRLWRRRNRFRGSSTTHKSHTQCQRKTVNKRCNTTFFVLFYFLQNQQRKKIKSSQMNFDRKDQFCRCLFCNLNEFALQHTFKIICSPRIVLYGQLGSCVTRSFSYASHFVYEHNLRIDLLIFIRSCEQRSFFYLYRAKAKRNQAEKTP